MPGFEDAVAKLKKAETRLKGQGTSPSLKLPWPSVFSNHSKYCVEQDHCDRTRT
jgi:hypothetical protein